MLQRRLRRLASPPHLQRPSVRLQLTLIYGGLFLVSGAVLLAITYVLFGRATEGPVFASTTRIGPGPPGLPSAGQLQAQTERLDAAADRQHAAELHQLLVQSGIALAIMAVVSIAVGWLVAPTRPTSPPPTSYSRSGTRTPTRSPRPSRSQLAGSDASSESPKRSRQPRAPATD